MSILYAILASKGGERWLVQSRNGPAIFLSEAEATKHIESIRATGIDYAIVEFAGSLIGVSESNEQN